MRHESSWMTKSPSTYFCVRNMVKTRSNSGTMALYVRDVEENSEVFITFFVVVFIPKFRWHVGLTNAKFHGLTSNGTSSFGPIMRNAEKKPSSFYGKKDRRPNPWFKPNLKPSNWFVHAQSRGTNIVTHVALLCNEPPIFSHHRPQQKQLYANWFFTCQTANHLKNKGFSKDAAIIVSHHPKFWSVSKSRALLGIVNSSWLRLTRSLGKLCLSEKNIWHIFWVILSHPKICILKTKRQLSEHGLLVWSPNWAVISGNAQMFWAVYCNSEMLQAGEVPQEKG